MDDDDNYPLDQLAEIIDGLAGFNSTSAYTEAELVNIFDEFLDEAGAAANQDQGAQQQFMERKENEPLGLTIKYRGKGNLSRRVRLLFIGKVIVLYFSI